MHGKELSYNNYNDLFAGLEILQSLNGKTGTVIIKHANPCGISINKNPMISFKRAYECDPLSAFGGVIACNYRMNEKVAPQSIPQLVLILADYQYKNAFVADHELNVVACLTEVMSDVQFN